MGHRNDQYAVLHDSWLIMPTADCEAEFIGHYDSDTMPDRGGDQDDTLWRLDCSSIAPADAVAAMLSLSSSF